MIKALVFDFDGLILETENPVFQSWQELFQQYGREVKLDYWLQFVGTNEVVFDPVGDLERMIGGKINQDVDLPRRLQRETELIAALDARPGVEDYLKAGKERNLKIGLASSSPCDWVEKHLDRLGLTEYFDEIVARDDVQRTKPDPELYLTACKRLEVQPHEAVAFEDSLHGLIAAKHAGMYCVVVPTELTQGLPLDDADVRLASMAEQPLDSVLGRLNGHRH